MRLQISHALTLACLLSATCTASTPAFAQSWAENWFDNVTYTSPGSFEDQTRGYRCRPTAVLDGSDESRRRHLAPCRRSPPHAGGGRQEGPPKYRWSACR